MVNIDGIIGLMVFVVFVAWSFVYFFDVFATQRAQPLAEAVNDVSDEIAGYLGIDVYEIPVAHDSAGSVSNAVFYFDYVWPSQGAKNSTMVYNNDGTALDCNITGSRLYWKSDAISGKNYFTVSYANKNVTMNCTGGPLGNPVNKTIPWSAVKKSMISQTMISRMTASDYSNLKNVLNIKRDFRVEINISGSVTAYGMPAPNATSVYVKKTRHAMEAGRQADITVLVW